MCEVEHSPNTFYIYVVCYLDNVFNYLGLFLILSFKQVWVNNEFSNFTKISLYAFC